MIQTLFNIAAIPLLTTFLLILFLYEGLEKLQWTVFPFKSKGNLLNNNELTFYKVLKQALEGTPYTVFAKVGLGDLADDIKKNIPMFFYWRMRTRHVDFVICDEQMRPFKAIELDGWSHEMAYEKKKDEYKDKLFKVIGLPLIRIKVKSNYPVEELRNEILSSMF